ncbi:hypothetical protein HT105_23520 [Bacteroides fragilis]|nr:hypothetical protein [Bacteroides fragilis]
MKSIFISGGCGGFGLAVARIFRNEGNPTAIIMLVAITIMMRVFAF